MVTLNAVKERRSDDGIHMPKLCKANSWQRQQQKRLNGSLEAGTVETQSLRPFQGSIWLLKTTKRTMLLPKSLSSESQSKHCWLHWMGLICCWQQ